MLISKENYEIRRKIFEFEKRTDDMHLDFYKFYHGTEQKAPEWERLEQELIFFSRKAIPDLELSKNLDRVLYKFQNRKKIWLQWFEEAHHRRTQEEEPPTGNTPLFHPPPASRQTSSRPRPTPCARSARRRQNRGLTSPAQFVSRPESPAPNLREWPR